MRVVMAAAEVAPFARVGGLSDVAGALSKAIAALGHDVAVFLPKYATIDERKYGLAPAPGVPEIGVAMGSGVERVRLWTAPMPGSDRVRVFFIGHDGAFGRKGIYVDPSTGEGYPDEVERYALFSRAVLEAARTLELRPSVLHLNDHHTALAAVYLKTAFDDDPALGSPGVVFSIHNLGYLGGFDKALLPRIGLSVDRSVYGSPFEYHGGVSTLKLGIEYADYVNTVSEQYAREIASSAEYGLGLEGVLAEKEAHGRLVGILNGVDTTVWDPATDPRIPARYRSEDLAGKRACKVELLKRSGLSSDLAMPLVGMVSRLADQKGFDLVREGAERMIELGVNVVILGTGQQVYHEFLSALARRYPDRVSVHLAFDEDLSHWIEAGSDMFLMPSRYEPCGLNQMYSLRYGTVPVVRATGGLVDTVADYDPARDAGTGFVFRDYTGDAMLGALRRAVELHRNHAAWTRLLRRGMAVDLSWRASALRYADLYEKAARAAGQAR